MKTISAIKLVNTNDPVYNKLSVGEGGNRTPTKTSVSRLAESIKKNNLLEYRPILVWKEDKRKENYVIIDGQTRYMACHELKEPFYMQEIQNKKREDLLGILSVLNTNQNNWGLGDFAKYWASKAGTRRVYKRYLRYYEEHKVTHGILITIYAGETKRKGRNIEFKNGELEDSPAILKHVEETLYKLRQLEYAAFNPALLRRTLRKQQFQSAMLTAFNTSGFDFNKFLKNLYDTRHCFNKLAKAIDMEKEIYRIESR
jgi:hypothetical protein